jgi:DtxR family Mn-dependent transcriptional regulator
MSDKVERRIMELLGNPTESPYGNPIPGLEELGIEPAEGFMDGVANLLDLLQASGEDSTGVIRRLGEPAQINPETLAEFAEYGLVPGSTISFKRDGDRVRVSAEGFTGSLDLTLDVAVHIFVEHIL